jgi:U3 small nucleolar RNA-associated protein 11
VLTRVDIRTARNKAAKEVDDLGKRVTGIQGEGQKIKFADDQDEQLQKLQADVEMGNEDAEEDLISKKLRHMREKETRKLENKLLIARQRLEVLTETEEALDLQRAKMTKAPSVGGINKNGVKFKSRERKK